MSSKYERLTNLVFHFLAQADRPGNPLVDHQHAAEKIPGYALDDSGTPRGKEALRKMFQRDCRELLQAGVPLIGNDEGWRLLREEYSLPEVEFTPAEAQILALAGKMGTGEELGAFSRSGWLKLAASGAATEFTTTPSIAPNADLATFNPKAYTTITSAINTRQRISFYYQRDRAADLIERWMDPWGLVYHGHRLYLVGFDVERKQPRSFRATKISEVEPLPLTAADRAEFGDFHPTPTGLDLQQLVREQLSRATTPITARVRATGSKAHLFAAHGITEADGTITLKGVDLDSFVRECLPLAPEVEILEPVEARALAKDIALKGLSA